MDPVRAIIELVKYLACCPLSQEVSYIKDLPKNLEKLRRNCDVLDAQSKDVRIEIERAESQGRIIKNEVTNWLTKVDELREELVQIEKDFEDYGRCLKGWLPNFISRWRLGKRTLNLIDEETTELIGQGKHLCGAPIDVDQPPEKALCLQPTSTLVGEVAKKCFQDIWEYITSDQVASIGVYGMGGVGKTTIMKNICNALRNKNIFRAIIMVTISQDVNLIRLQKSIAERLGLELPNDHECYSSKIYGALIRRQKVLLILDDLWCRISLEDLGIPKPEAQNGCKVVITSRSYAICQRMEIQTCVNVGVLCKNDAWYLFKEKVGSYALNDSDLEDIAKEVVQECGGLPLAIITLGLALRNEKGIEVWRHALHELRNSTLDFGDIERQVIEKLKYSYIRLRNKKMQSCFLYCSLFPEDELIDAERLINYWIWEGFIEEGENIEVELDRGRILLKELKELSMLETEYNKHHKKLYYRMHDTIRDMAISITRSEPLFMIKAGRGLEKPPESKQWIEDVEKISLMNNKIEALSIEPKCPKLQTLLLNRNSKLGTISPAFFEGMDSLQVLDLSYTRIKVLPESVSKLENLRALVLEGCGDLKNLPCLKNLKNLRYLYLSDAWSLEELPDSLCHLESLRELTLTGSECIESLPSLANIKNLRSLQVSGLSITELPDSLHLESLCKLVLWRFNHLKSLPSLAGLKKLMVLSVRYAGIEKLPDSLSDVENLKCLDLRGCKELKSLPSLAKLKKLEFVDLGGTCIEELPSSTSGLANLKELCLYGCKNLKSVTCSFAKLKRLKTLDLYDTCIEELPEGMEQLVSLETLNLTGTKQLSRFPIGVLPKLSSLRHLFTEDSSCLFSTSGSTSSSSSSSSSSANTDQLMEITKSRTRTMRVEEIVGLSQLSSVAIDFADIESFSMYVRCVKLSSFAYFDFRVMKPAHVVNDGNYLLNIRRNKHYYHLCEIREWDDIVRLSDFLPEWGLLDSKECAIEIIRCRRVECVFAAAAEHGQQQTLTCGMGILHLVELPNLEAIYKVKGPGPPPPTLEHATSTFARLTSLTVIRCPKLKNLLPDLKLLRCLRLLWEIRVEDCSGMEKMVAESEEEEDMDFKEEAVVTLPSLKSLTLKNLPELKSICSRAIVLNSFAYVNIRNCLRLKRIPFCINQPGHQYKELPLILPT